MKKRRVAALFMAAAMAVRGMTGCGSSDTATTEAAKTEAGSEAASKEETEAAKEETIDVKSLPAGSVDLSIMLPLGQWTDNFNMLIDAYKAEHPEIG